MIFAPPRTRGAVLAVAVAVAGLALGLALLLRGFTLQVSSAAFVCYTLGAILLVAASPLAYWAYAVSALHYELKQGALVIRWGAVQHVISVHDVQRVVLGRNLAVPMVSGLRLPGVAVGKARVNKVGPAMVWARYRGPEDLVYLVTSEGAVGIGLEDAQPFIRALQQAQGETPPRPVIAGLRRGKLGSFGFWSDRRVLWLGGVALFLAWLTAGVVYTRFQGQPLALIVHFPATEIAHLAPRDRLLQIPEGALALLGFSALAAVLLFNRARIVSYLVLGGAAVSGALLLVAAIGATG